jgi:hypothetical protein
VSGDAQQASFRRFRRSSMAGSPFPGVDPYIEALGLWESFHAALITYCRDGLNEVLPEYYVAALGVRLDLVDLTEAEPREIIPDVLISRRCRRSAAASGRVRQASSTVTIEPVMNALPGRRTKVEVRIPLDRDPPPAEADPGDRDRAAVADQQEWRRVL